MSEGWTDSIVTFFDLDGVKKHAPSGDGSTLMRCLHDFIGQRMAEDRFETVNTTYVWNDSVLLLAHVDAYTNWHERVLRDADTLKREIDRRIDTLQHRLGIANANKSLAVAVKGQAFPPPTSRGTQREPRFVFIEASSYALGNCFDIPKHFAQLLRIHDWYVDGRIVNCVPRLRKCADQEPVSLLPSRKERIVHAYDGYLWDRRSPANLVECSEEAERDSR